MNLDDPEVSILEKQLESRVRKDIFEAKGKEVNLDYFLYSCFEQEQTRKALETPGSATQWLEVYKDEVAEGELEDLVGDMFAWYGVQCPEMTSGNVLDHGAAAEIVPTFVRLVHELTQLHKAKTGEDRTPERSDGETPQPKFWDDIDRHIEKKFPRHARQMEAYLDWRFGPGADEEVDLKSVPPVGRLGKLLLRGRLKKKGPPRGGDRDRPQRGGDRDRKLANGPGGQENARPRSGAQDGSGRASKGRSDRGKQDGGKRFGGKDQNRRPDKRGPQGGSDVEREKQVIAEAEAGVERMRLEPNLSELVLKPQNSFLRRIQHQFIVDAGFRTESIGENADRAVKIMR